MNKYIIAGAGAGKTTYLVTESIRQSDKKILITTYTEANEREIRKKFLEINNGVPKNVTIQTWFTFLLKEWVKPFQGTFNSLLFDYDIKGMILVNSMSGIKNTFINQYGKKIEIQYAEDTEFLKHYFSKKGKIYSDKIAKFSYNVDSQCGSVITSRLKSFYDKIYIDEVQDLAGYDLELIKLLLKSKIEIELVGDPRQVTYLTHNPKKNQKYTDGNLKGFLLEKCKSLIKDNIYEGLLNESHRNNHFICDFANKLYPTYEKLRPCKCCNYNEVEHLGVFLIREDDVSNYIEKYNPTQLKWSSSTKVNDNSDSLNFGESKGLTFDRVLIYPTENMKAWMKDNNKKLESSTRAKFYVAITRARHSVAIVFNYDTLEISDCIKYSEII
ncbi:UvrD-helicase domain-containing protein [Myroides sp. M-43]|uniref:UvrD-helicase domain-containing protein n=1 Tax=Myroides oncorhynchi TaxID=2893756 RepID=UPI001E41D997|nr:UvrD-helicase domain-containing protein [Myroides oncorhynchi]MCC9043883.1 UvrD-helicase domain-containing protein [Myroides oncorhynchi]